MEVEQGKKVMKFLISSCYLWIYSDNFSRVKSATRVYNSFFKP